MTSAVAITDAYAAVLERVVVGGDLSALSPRDRMEYYRAICVSVGLNPLTRPFDFLTLSGRLVLYAKRDATDQLRKINGVSIEKLERETVEGVYAVTAYARDSAGRVDSSIGAVPIEGLKGEAKANAMMKAETKAKRRVTLSICGLGMLDETEAGSIPDARPAWIDHETGEVLDSGPGARVPPPEDPDSAFNGGAIPDDPPLSERLESEARPLDEAQERTLLLARIKAQADRAPKLDARTRAGLWDAHVGGDPRDAPIEKLADLYAALKAR